MTQKLIQQAIDSLGKGFDLTSDFRLKYCKGKHRLVLLNENESKDLLVPGFGSFKGASSDIKCDKGDRVRFQSDILDFNQMSEFFNQKCSGPGKIPNGFFNAMFGFQSGSWATDAANTKYLGLDGYFIQLFNVHIDRYPLILSDEVRNAVPTTWDPPALARFIEKYGTHIIVGISIGGQDVILMKQNKSSNLEASQLKNHLENLGDQLLNGACTFSPHQLKSKDHKNKTPLAFSSVFDLEPMFFNGFSSATTKDGLSVMCSKRGGDLMSSTHCEWLLTVPSMPDAINFDFIPITSLLPGVPGKGFLSHAINLYLRYKPPIEDLEYFLDFQAHKLWAPVHSDLSLGPTTNRAIRSPALNFSLMGPKLYVNTTQVTVAKMPVTGMRLYLEGMKCNRLAIHLQHLSGTPVLFQDRISEALNWRGSEEIGDSRFFEPIQWKKFSHVCTAPVKYDPDWALPGKDASYIVTGAQLHVKNHDSRSILHIRLLYSKVSSSCIVQSSWASGPVYQSQRSGFLSAISQSLSGNPEKELKSSDVVVDSGIYPNGPPVEVPTPKLLKFVDMTQICRGPRDNPGHWLVTGAKLHLDKGKIRLLVKFSLLNIC
ncbi:MACPF domain-containing protein At1g14780 [Cynara cardunculus var. scolymus]|uniref:MACPF domain-containing protein At1g14780 n=1 Tax=Cynara cardunculus var. scolymus TaxID=59895 RepID=UPI000D6308CE|nr:MACPF domain-containing protein At1g14780 [Cynara cardunculus var. scolymus]